MAIKKHWMLLDIPDMDEVDFIQKSDIGITTIIEKPDYIAYTDIDFNRIEFPRGTNLITFITTNDMQECYLKLKFGRKLVCMEYYPIDENLI